MAAQNIVDFKTATVERSEGPVDPAKVIEGEPRQTTENLYTDNAGKLFSGYWSSTAGKWRIDYSGEEEFCHMLEGTIELTDEQGGTNRFTAGDKFVIPAGFKGTWTTIIPCKKIYVISLVSG